MTRLSHTQAIMMLLREICLPGIFPTIVQHLQMFHVSDTSLSQTEFKLTMWWSLTWIIGPNSCCVGAGNGSHSARPLAQWPWRPTVLWHVKTSQHLSGYWYSHWNIVQQIICMPHTKYQCDLWFTLNPDQGQRHETDNWNRLILHCVAVSSGATDMYLDCLIDVSFSSKCPVSVILT